MPIRIYHRSRYVIIEDPTSLCSSNLLVPGGRCDLRSLVLRLTLIQ